MDFFFCTSHHILSLIFLINTLIFTVSVIGDKGAEGEAVRQFSAPDVQSIPFAKAFEKILKSEHIGARHPPSPTKVNGTKSVPPPVPSPKAAGSPPAASAPPPPPPPPPPPAKPMSFAEMIQKKALQMPQAKVVEVPAEEKKHKGGNREESGEERKKHKGGSGEESAKSDKETKDRRAPTPFSPPRKMRTDEEEEEEEEESSPESSSENEPIKIASKLLRRRATPHPAGKKKYHQQKKRASSSSEEEKEEISFEKSGKRSGKSRDLELTERRHRLATLAVTRNLHKKRFDDGGKRKREEGSTSSSESADAVGIKALFASPEQTSGGSHRKGNKAKSPRPPKSHRSKSPSRRSSSRDSSFGFGSEDLSDEKAGHRKRYFARSKLPRGRSPMPNSSAERSSSDERRSYKKRARSLSPRPKSARKALKLEDDEDPPRLTKYPFSTLKLPRRRISNRTSSSAEHSDYGDAKFEDFRRKDRARELAVKRTRDGKGVGSEESEEPQEPKRAYRRKGRKRQRLNRNDQRGHRSDHEDWEHKNRRIGKDENVYGLLTPKEHAHSKFAAHKMPVSFVLGIPLAPSPSGIFPEPFYARDFDSHPNTMAYTKLGEARHDEVQEVLISGQFLCGRRKKRFQPDAVYLREYFWESGVWEHWETVKHPKWIKRLVGVYALRPQFGSFTFKIVRPIASYKNGGREGSGGKGAKRQRREKREDDGEWRVLESDHSNFELVFDRSKCRPGTESKKGREASRAESEEEPSADEGLCLREFARKTDWHDREWRKALDGWGTCSKEILDKRNDRICVHRVSEVKIGPGKMFARKSVGSIRVDKCSGWEEDVPAGKSPLAKRERPRGEKPPQKPNYGPWGH